MDRRIHQFIFVVLLFVVVPTMFTKIALGHTEDEAGPQDAFDVARETFGSIHYFFFILIIITCYYFRYISETTVMKNPRSSGLPRAGYRGDRIVYQFHRYFYWIGFVLIIIYLIVRSVWLPMVLASSEFNILQKTTLVLEYFVGIVFLLYLAGCFHLKSLFEGLVEKEQKPCAGCWKNSMCGKQSTLNDWHGYFFWFSVFGIIALHVFFIFGGHVG